MKKKLELTADQLQELKYLARHSPLPHVRVKALAVYNLQRGIPCSQVARFLAVERRSVGRWVCAYLSQGAAAFAIKAGRGRRSQVDGEEVEHYLRQRPVQFGIPRTRWTLALLGQLVPSLKGMGKTGIRKALAKMGYRYKRGQPAIHSPDPLYGEKRGLWWRP